MFVAVPSTENDNEDEKVKEESADTVPKVLMPKVPRIGLGGNLMAEMKLKQEKRLSQRISPESKKSPTVTVSFLWANSRCNFHASVLLKIHLFIM